MKRVRQFVCRWARVACLNGVVLSAASNVQGAECAAPWQRWPQVGSQLIRPLPLGLIAGSAIPPLVMSPSGWDQDLRVFSQTKMGGSYDPEPVSIGTPYVALGATTATWISLHLLKVCEGQKATAAMLQGVGMTLVFVGFTKWATGRTWPNGGQDPYAEDTLDHPEYAQQWRPFRNGAIAAFPSGHTATMFAFAAALRTSSPELGIWRYIGYPIAGAIGFAMWYGDHHWVSDILSGAMVGEALGASAGHAWSGAEPPKISWMFLPAPGGGYASVNGHF